MRPGEEKTLLGAEWTRTPLPPEQSPQDPLKGFKESGTLALPGFAWEPQQHEPAQWLATG